MRKAILLVDHDGMALSTATLCVDATDEARAYGLPMLSEMLARLSTGHEWRRNDDSSYELFRNGERIGILQILDLPA